MKIAGFQKLTLIDYPKKIACTLFLHGCNFRCGFCHNPKLVLQEPDKIYSEEEILDFLEKRKKYLDGVCITGGEPLLSLDLNFLEKIKKMGYLIKIDINGGFPEKLKELIDKELIDFVAMDIKSDENNYFRIICSEIDLAKIEESIRIIVNSDIEYEFRTTCIKDYHTYEIIDKIGKWILEIAGRKPKKYCIQKFIRRENGLIDENFLKVEEMSDNELEELKNVAENYFEKTEVRK